MGLTNGYLIFILKIRTRLFTRRKFMEEQKDKPCCPEGTVEQTGTQACCGGPAGPPNKTVSLVKKGLFTLIILAALGVAVHAVLNKDETRRCKPECAEKTEAEKEKCCPHGH
jgi:hypothetical protein